MRLAFCLIGGDEWYAGYVLLHNYIRCLQAAAPSVEIELLAPASMHAQTRLRLEAYFQVPLRPLRDADGLVRLASGDEYAAIFVSVTPQLSLATRTPWIALLYDFRHKRRPEQFSQQVIASRDREFAYAAQHAAAVALLSHDCRRDFARYYPDMADKALVFPPVAFLDDAQLYNQPDKLVRYYKLPENYIYFPSQYWEHKNHRLAIQALAQAPDVTLVLSGARDLEYNLDHYERLQEFIAASGCAQRIRQLGAIPYKHVLNLMRRSLAVLQPSTFEGFGLPVSEAAALGKPVLLSDIPTHREHEVQDARYFAPHDHTRLAALLQATSAPASRVVAAQNVIAAERHAIAAMRAKAATHGALVLDRIRDIHERRRRARFFCPGLQQDPARIEAAVVEQLTDICREAGATIFHARDLDAYRLDAAVAAHATLAALGKGAEAALFLCRAAKLGLGGAWLERQLATRLSASGRLRPEDLVRLATQMRVYEAASFLLETAFEGDKSVEDENAASWKIERTYGLALGLQADGRYADAQRLYERLLARLNTDTAVDATLRSWICFKQAEMLLESAKGQPDPAAPRAAALLREALALNPSHVKARILLLAPEEPLRVSLGPDAPPAGWLQLDFDVLNGFFWEYYFAARPLDRVRLTPSPVGPVSNAALAKIAAHLARYLAPHGIATLYFDKPAAARKAARVIGGMQRGGLVLENAGVADGQKVALVWRLEP